MAECGICLDVIRNPVSIPCGHVHCERCLRGHISSGTDALKSACPTCRKPFHIATPDFSFVPQKYHDFILPGVRKIYMDIPSVAAMAGEIDALTRRLEALTKENEHLHQRCTDYKYMVDDAESEKRAIIVQEGEARQEAAQLRKKYDSLKKKYEAQSCDHSCTTMPLQTLSRRSMETCCEISPKVEEPPVSLQDLYQRPKRALPKSRLSNSMRRKDEQLPLFVKRQRTHRHSGVCSTSQLMNFSLKDEDEDEDEDSD